MATKKSTYRRRESPEARTAARHIRALYSKEISTAATGDDSVQPYLVEAREAVRRVLRADGISWDRLLGYESTLFRIVADALVEVDFWVLGPGREALDQRIKDVEEEAATLENAASILEQEVQRGGDADSVAATKLLRTHAELRRLSTKMISFRRRSLRRLVGKPDAARARATALTNVLGSHLPSVGIRLTTRELGAIVTAAAQVSPPFGPDDVRKALGPDKSSERKLNAIAKKVATLPLPEEIVSLPEDIKRGLGRRNAKIPVRTIALDPSAFSHLLGDDEADK